MRPRQIFRFLLITFGISFTIWFVWGYQSVDVPVDILKTTPAVKVTDDGSTIRFQPRANKRASGILFLPGGMVDPLAYTPLLKDLAAAGHPAQLIRLPLRCACVDSQINSLFAAISAAVKASPETRWFLAGHSRGAMLAARYARESETRLAGLILIATTHPRDFDLSSSNLKITKIFGTHDGIADSDTIRNNAKLLPPAAAMVEIPGANHVQFGYYRHQLLDGIPGISREEQQKVLLRVVRRALAN